MGSVSRKPVIWCYLGNRAGTVQELAPVALDGGGELIFADDDDRARFRRIIEDNLRKTATDTQLITIARMLDII